MDTPKHRRRARTTRGRSRSRPAGAPPATPENLRRAALGYLRRYASSAAHLRGLLVRKVRRSAAARGTDLDHGLAAIDALMESLVGAGLLNDAVYAEARARRLLYGGNAPATVRAALAAKGVAPALIDGALRTLHAELAQPELAAALVYARRRNLGPYRRPAERTNLRARDLAALGRRGFSLDIARRVVDAEEAESLEREAGLSRAATL